MNFDFKIIERAGALSEKKGVTLELNRISFNGDLPRWDLRRWAGGQMLKGITLSDEELQSLRSILNSMDKNQEVA